ncbi:SgcJ/EcaC family oxidoreductase [Cohnella silvisoli]|uniref:SgcJ/EcaC family oxidoreductase n=1 Tax=Cohnella silvisoli TaxID=2873699 RepID=A0ABV1KS00_9BACL|nr:SgcJ/EcaC family oxidoreductase [Cohnella silvisoli]MCD9022525.1 SgcJ/EcaC family oxidoreductase [Cohnella silvisoli]
MANQSNNTYSAEEKEIYTLYQQLLQGWNNRNADDMAKLFAEDGELIGYDGTFIGGQSEISAHLAPIFADHPTAAYVNKVRVIRLLGPDIAYLRAVAGMVPRGQSELNPNVHAHQTIMAVKQAGNWRIKLFQNTPVQLHGRPEEVQQLTDELSQLLS